MKLLFVFLLVLLVVSGEEQKKPLVLHGKQRRWTADDLKEHHRQQRKTQEDDPPTYTNVPIFANITVGTPGATFQVTLVGDSQETFVLAREYPGRLPTQLFYDPGQSSTWEYEGEYDKKIGNGYELRGSIYGDVIGLYDIGFKANMTQQFGAVRDIALSGTSREPKMPDGELGLAWTPQDAAHPSEYSSAIVNLFKAIGGPRYYCQWVAVHGNPYYGGEHDVATSFGSCLDDLCRPPTPENTFPLIWNEKIQLLAFTVDSFTYKGKQREGGNAIVDPTIPTILMSFDAFLSVYEDVYPQLDYDLGIWTVDCRKAKSLPDWTFTIGGKNFTIPSTAYVVDLGLAFGRCALNADESNRETNFVFGCIFHDLWCTKMDIDHQTISLMDVIPSTKKPDLN